MKAELLKLLLESALGEDKPEAKKESSILQVGKLYHVRTVTYATMGELKEIDDHFLKFTRASWVADTGRFSEFVKDPSKVNENEFVGEIIVSRDAIVDVIELTSLYEATK